MIEVLRFGAVPVPPREALAELAGSPVHGPVMLVVEELRKQGHAVDPILVDQHLLTGNLRRAAQLATGRRAAVIEQLARFQRGEARDAAALLAIEDSEACRGIAAVFAAWAAPTSTSQQQIQQGLAAVRKTHGPTAVARLALVAALALHEAGQPELAMVEALRSLARAHAAEDRRLDRMASRVVRWLRSHSQDAHIAQLVAVTRELGHHEHDVLFDRIAQATLELVRGADRAFVLLGKADTLDVVGRALGPGESGSPSLAIAAGVVLQGREVITQDVGAIAQSESIEAMELRTALCIPLVDQHRCIGAIYADSRSATDQDLQEVAWLLRAFAAYSAVVVKNRQLLDDATRRTLHAREVAHDLRNVASGMQLGLDELEELVSDGEARITLGDLRQMNRALIDALQGLLDQRTPTRGDLDLAALVGDGVKLLRFQARAKGVKIQLKADPARIHGSSEELGRVVANLVGNALKYSESGDTVQIRVGAKSGRAYVIVADEGPGIPEDALEAIFASGRQAEGAKAGHGLGLAICRAIVVAHGGSLQAANRSGRGAKFTAVLPLLPGAPRDA